jgi:hypothetical protein
MTLRNYLKLSAIMMALAIMSPLPGQQESATQTPATQAGPQTKELYLPAQINRVPAGNDFKNPESDYSFSRMLEGPDAAVFWHKMYGDDPTKNPDENLTFDPKRILAEVERFIDYYINEMEYVKKGSSISDKYKVLIFIFEAQGPSGTAFGGGIENKVGAFWAPAGRVHREPYGVVAHELAHSFQFMSRLDSGTGAGGGEMAAQYFLWQVLPEWQTFENYHLSGRGADNFMDQTHLAFMHSGNQYHSPYVFEYWSYKHGLKFWGDLNRDTKPGEDVVTTYKRMQGLSQDQFNDEMFDAVRRFITWDMPRIQQTSKPYRNQHRSALIADKDGWFRIDPSLVPQNYGYNGIKLEVPKAGTQVKLEFKGIAGTDGYSSRSLELAGWRYGFVAYRRDETRVYSDTWKDSEAAESFTVPEDTEYLWLVVMGAPEDHFPVAGRRGGGGGRRGRGAVETARGNRGTTETARGGRGAVETARGNRGTTETARGRRGAGAQARGGSGVAAPAAEAWPYMVKLTNTSIDTAFIK